METFPTWTQSRSVQLSLWCTRAMIGLAILVGIILPVAISYGFNVGGALIKGTHGYWLLPIYYTICIPAFVALGCAHKLLSNISQGQVFDQANVRLLRIISWSGLAGGVICVAATPASLAFLAFGLVCLFFAVILRVVKNVIAAAVQLKTENDYTI
jgi:hypothetical protein